ncbi:MAG TPA: sulfatase [Thermoanaerobaculia bacterium]|nr:sulfatase [Thermoanaerobaculia bacterium]
MQATVRLAITFALLDLGAGLLLRGAPPSTVHLAGWSLLAGAALLAAFGLGWGIAVAARLPPQRAALAVAAGLACAVVLFHLLPDDALGLRSGGVLLLVSGMVALLAYRSLDGARAARWVPRLLLAAPLALAPAVLLLVAERLWLPGWWSPASLLGAAGAAALTLALLLHLRRGGRWPAVAAPWVLAALLAGLLVAPRLARPVAPAATVDTADRPRLVLLVTIDTLRLDHGPCRLPGGPALARFCAEADRYAGAVSPSPWTLPALASILTGVPVAVHGADELLSRLPRELPVLAELLARRGYRTAAFGDNPLLASGGLGRGFGEHDLFPKVGKRSSLAPWLFDVAGLQMPGALALEVGAEGITERGWRWLRRSETPAFLWLHYMDPHLPYEPPPRLVRGAPAGRFPWRFEGMDEVRAGLIVPDASERRRIRELYRAETLQVQLQLERLFSRLQRTGRWRDAVVVVAGDHGEELWDHGGFGHGHTQHEELLRVPLLVKRRGAGAGGRIAGRVTTAALAPTLLRSAGARVPAHMVAPLATAAPGNAEVVSESCLFYTERVALSFGDHKYVLDRDLGEERLYDLAADPGERRPLAPGELPSLWAEARRRLAEADERALALRARLGLPSAEPRPPDDATTEALRSLGYLR